MSHQSPTTPPRCEGIQEGANIMSSPPQSSTFSSPPQQSILQESPDRPLLSQPPAGSGSIESHAQGMPKSKILQANSSQSNSHSQQPTASTPSELTFYQKHFTKPAGQDSETSIKTPRRQFSMRSRGFIATAIMLLLVLVAIIGAAVGVTVDDRHHRHQTPIPGLGTSPEVPAATPVVPAEAPVRTAVYSNFPDPSIWYDNGVWYAYATNNGAGIIGGGERNNQTGRDGNKPGDAHEPAEKHDNFANVQIATSSDYITWDLLNQTHDALPTLGKWATQGKPKQEPKQENIPRGNVWAPAIFRRPMDNKYVLYYSANAVRTFDTPPNKSGKPHRRPPAHCMGAALSDSPLGPFVPLNATIACPMERGGAIDPAVIVDDDGSIYVAWKIDGNNAGHGGVCGNTVKPIVKTPIMMQKMKANGVEADGEAIQILTNEAEDGPLVEAPALVRSKEGVYFLFFSSGCTRYKSYNVKYATATSITGPYKRAKKPLLQTGDFTLTAPGSVGIHRNGNDGYNMAFHARVPINDVGVRAMFTTTLEFDKHTVKMVKSNATKAH